MKQRCLSLFLVLCLIFGMAPAITIPAAAAEPGGALELPKGAGSGKGFIYYNFVETTTFTPGTTYAFLDAVYGQDDAVAQLGSGAVLEATDTKNDCLQYMKMYYYLQGVSPDEILKISVTAYVNVVKPGKGFDHCPAGGLYRVPDTSNPTEYRYFCRAGGAQNCGPLYAYTYDTAEVTWENVTVYLNDPGNTSSNNSADYTVKLTYGQGQTVTLDPRSYTVSCSGKTATVTITDNDGNTIRGTVTLPCGVVYQPGGLNVTGMPANQGILPGGTVTAAQGPTRSGYVFQHWTDSQQPFAAGADIPYKADGNYTLTAVWKDVQKPEFTCGTVEVMTGTSGEMVQNSIKAALKITDNEPVTECTVTVDADDTTAKTRGDTQVSVTVRDAAGNETTKNVTLTVLPGPLAFSEPVYESGTLSATLLEPGPDDITETGIVWSVMSNPTTTVNNGVYVTPSPVTTPDTSISTPVELAQGVPYYARAYAVVNGVTYYGPQSTIGDDIPEYGVFTITNSGGNTFTVSRSGGSDGEQTVSYRTVNGSAVGGVHFTHQNSTLTFAAGETSKTITITEQGVNAIYGGNAATGYSNDSRTYSVEIYRVDGGAVIENNRAAAKRTMTGSTTVDPSLYNEKTINGTQTVVQQSHDSWSDNANETVTVTVENKEYCQGTADYLKYWVTFQACEEEDGYQAIQICAGSEIDTGLSHDNDGNIGNVNDAGRTAVYAASFMHGGDGRNTSYAEYTFPTDSAATWNNGSGLSSYSYKDGQSGNFIAFDFDIETITLGFKASGKDQDDWFRQNVVHHFQVSDTQEPQLLAVADMGDSTYRVGDSFTVSLIFDEIVDSTNSTLSGKTITTSWGTATYAGGANTNVLYFTGTVPANATNTLTVTGIDASAVIKDMAGNGGSSSANGSVDATVDTRTPSFDLSTGSISGGVARATISNANGNTTALRYAWSQSADLPATGWIPLTSEELAAAQTPGGFQAMTRQDAGSGVWYLHVLGVCDGNGALAYQQTSVDFGTGGSVPGDPDPAPPAPSISVSVDNTNWATSRTITVTYANGNAEYRYGTEAWQPVSGGSVTVTKNGTYAFRCVSSSGEAATASAAVEKIDTIDPTASIGAMAANTPTQKDGVYHSITLPINYGDTQSGVKTAEYVWSSSATAPNSGWTAVGSDTQLTYTAAENSETGIYLHLRVTDQVGHAVTVSSPAYQMISEEGAKNYAPTITIGLANKGGEGFTPWDGTSWTNETQTLEWKLVGEHTENCVVTLPDGRTTTDTSGTILVSQNGTYTVSVVDNTYGGSHSSSYTIDKIDTTAPTATHTEAPTGWQSSPVTIDFTFTDQGGSGLHTAQYAVVTDNTTPPADLTAFSANTGGSVTVSQDGEWYIYYAVTDGTAGTYGDGTPRSANTTSGFVGPIQINTGKPTLEISGGETGADSLTLTVISDGSVKVSKDGGTAEPVSGTYTVTEAGTYTFTATSNSGLTSQKEVEVYSITFDSGVSPQLVVSGGTATQPADPQKTGYTFGGWKNGQTAWDFDAPVTADLTLTAQWTLDTPAVTLTASKTEVTYGEEITLTAHAGHSGGENVTLTYTWYKDDSKLTGETNASLTLKDVAHSGSYKVEVTASGDGQTQVSSSNTVEVTIAPRPVVLDWDYAAPIPYDGQTHTVTATITNLVDADVCQLTYLGTRESSSAGSHEVTVTALDNPNYTLDGAVNTTLVWQITSTSGSASVTMGNWTYGDPTKTPVPASDTHGTGSVTYRYTGTTTGGVPYDSDAVPTDAGNYTVTATFAATGHYEAVTATAEFTIAKKTISATWQGLNWVYGQPVQVDVLLSDIVKGDQVTVTVTGVGQTVGSHPLTATLEGADVDNYTLKNHTATLTIQPKPVLFAVADNVVQADGGEKGATVTADDKNCAYTVTYRQNGGQVTSPREAGSYEIWVKITDSSYRHTDGSSEMQVGTLTITQAPPVVHTVSFVGGEGTEGSMMSPLEAMGGSLLTLPDCGYQKDDYKFTGWLYNGQTYQPGGRFTMPEEDVIFTAQWQETFTISGIITEETDGEDAKVENAVVSLWLGANKMGETSTDKDGKYRFDNLTPGIYNLVVTKDVRTVTSKVELTKNTICNATLPKGATNSIVEVTPGSPDIVVGELDTVFDHPDDTVYTKADQTTVQAGGKVEITFTAAVKQKTDVATDLEKIQSISGSSSLALTMDYALTKTVTEPDGDKREPQSISQSNVLLEVLLPLPTELQGKANYSVYRVHSGQAQELKEGKANQNALGEYFTVSGDKTGLTLYVSCFSTYAVGYSDTPVTPTPPDNNSGGGGSGGGSSTPTYPPNIEQPEHGSVSIEPSKPQKGDEVTITPTPEDGYTVDEVIVTGPGGEAVEVTPNGDGSYTFTQPARKVTITVTFRQIADAADCPRDESCPMADFSDTDLHAWYHDGIHYCLEHGLMVGTGKHTFEPNTSTSRGMLVTILWRLEGSPVVDASMAYSDVKPEDWYGQAVGWGDQSGVVTGYGNGQFGPNDPITREQMAAMLWRYVGSPAVDGSLSSFVDGGQTSDWARTAMIWAVEQGLITGVGHDRLNPQGQATRAEAATILMRLIENRA